jgi:regulator of replication initiation timing
MDELDNKVAKLNSQLLVLQTEKTNLHRENVKFRQELQSFEHNEQALSKKLAKQMKENKELRY